MLNVCCLLDKLRSIYAACVRGELINNISLFLTRKVYLIGLRLCLYQFQPCVKYEFINRG